MEEKVFFQSADGVKLCGVWTPPAQPSNKAIVLAHGITVDKDEDGIFTNLAQLLASKDFAVLRFDFRGHGESEGESTAVTLTGEMADLDAAVEFARKKGYTSLQLLGASFGGGVSTLYTAKHPGTFQKLCLWNPVLDYEHTFLKPTLPWLVKRKGHMKREVEEQGWTTLGRGFKVGKPLFDEMAQMFPFKALRELTLPVLVVHGNNDMKVPYEDSAEYVKGLANVQLLTIQGAGHGFHDSEAHAQEASDTTIKFFSQ